MVITDSYHNDIEGKDYKYGSPTMIDNKSKPIILYYFLDDYERVWDEGKPISYDDEDGEPVTPPDPAWDEDVTPDPDVPDLLEDEADVEDVPESEGQYRDNC